MLGRWLSIRVHVFLINSLVALSNQLSPPPLLPWGHPSACSIRAGPGVTLPDPGRGTPDPEREARIVEASLSAGDEVEARVLRSGSWTPGLGEQSHLSPGCPDLWPTSGRGLLA